jgi:octaprenyl-diphosphate synthase
MLFAHALKICAALPGRKPGELIADAASEVCTGEILQSKNRFNFDLSIEDYIAFIRMKTAALFRAPTQIAGIINEVDAEKEEALRLFGESLGIAYQIYDDCLDLFGDEINSGKTLGTDLIVGKFTLPVLYYFSQISSAEKNQLIADKEKFIHDEEFRREFMQKVAEKNGHQVALKTCQEYLETAKAQLKVLVPNTYTRSLSSLCDIVLEQLTSIR